MMPMRLSRRELIKIGAVTYLMLPFGYVAAVNWGQYSAKREGLKFFSNKEADIMESIAEVIVPNQNELGVSIYDVNLIQQMDEYLADVPASNQSRIRLLLWVVEHLFPVRMLYPAKFTRLSFERRTRVLQELDREGQIGGRALVRALNSLTLTIFYNDPVVAARTGFIDKCRS